jgi:hypothetical protein
MKKLRILEKVTYSGKNKFYPQYFNDSGRNWCYYLNETNSFLSFDSLDKAKTFLSSRNEPFEEIIHEL